MIKQLYGAARKRKDAGKSGWSFLYKVNKLIANILCPLFFRFHRRKGVDETHEMIVSLTTFQDRIHTVWITISTMMNQTYKPKRIILWLAKEQFRGEEELPKNLLRLKKRGLEIAFCEDLKPHKKYFYTMKNNPEEYVVTIDDDVLYPENHLEELWKTHQKNPETVCCQYAHKITYDENGKIAAYENWESCFGEHTNPSFQIMPVGCGGVLYPPHCLSEELFRKEEIGRLCPFMDDLWLKSMAVLKGTKAVLCSTGSLIYFDIIGTRKSGLQHTNAGEKRNDVAMKAIITAYPQVNEFLYNDAKEEEKTGKR